MTFNFTVKEFILGGGNATPTLQFYKRGFNLGGSVSPSWQDVILSGNTSLTLVNAKANGLNYVKLFGGTEQRNLPSEYTQVEYLESDGNQYINTGVTLKSNSQIKLIAIDFNGGSAFGVNTSNNLYVIASSNLGMFYRLFSSDGALVGQTEGKHTYSFSGNKGFYDGSLVYTGGTPVDSTFSLYLFARNLYGSATSFGTGKISLFEIDNHKFIPCRRKSDNTLGMYDTVTGAFLTNAGTGTFTAGEDVVPTPDNPMDIVCNNGVVKVNTTGSGKNAIDTSDTEVGYLISTVGQQPRINTSTASIVIKNAIKVSNGKKYKFSYYSNVAGNREYNIVDNNGIVTLKIGLECNVGLNEYIIEANANGYLWVTVQNGDLATVKPTAYEIGLYTDGTVETVEVHSKNLFDKNNALLNTTVTEDGSFETNNSFNCSNYIPVQYGKNYIRSNNGTRFGVRYHLYDSNKNWLGYVDAAQTGLIVVNNSSAKYVAFAISKTVNLDNVQVEQGSRATAYEPYFNGGSATAEMLLKVGSYQDEQSILAGSVTRNVGIKVLDGTENIYDGTSGYWGIASSYFPNIKMKTSGAILATSWGDGDYLSPSGAYCSIAGTSYFAFNKASLPNASTAEAVKQWLADQYNAGTPVIIIYPLATATTESVTAQPLTIQEGTNIITAEGSIDNLGLEVSYKAGVVVTITEVQNANLSNSVTVTIGG